MFRILHILALTLLFITSGVLQAKTTVMDMPSGLNEALQKSLRKIEVIDEVDKPRSWRANIPGNHLEISFDGKGFDAISTQNEWHWGMELQQIGAPDKLISVSKAKTTSDGNRLTYDRGVIKEWYINDVKGMEQGFTVDRRLSRDQLVLEFGLRGNVDTKVVENGSALLLESPTGKRLRYEGLKAWDADGRLLPAKFSLENTRVHLTLAVAGAAYPLTIDPVLTEEAKLTATDAVSHDEFGISVDVSGNTAVVGTRDSAYIFVRSGGVWSEQAKLPTSSDGVPSIAVAISNDTAVVGDFRDGDAGRDAGAAYIFARNETGWHQQVKLIASDTQGGIGLVILSLSKATQSRWERLRMTMTMTI